MLEVHIRVHKTHCEILKHDIVPNGCVNAVVCYFSFDSFWDGFDMLASFESAYGTYHETIVDGKCSMRNEIIEHASSVRIGVIGVKDNVTVTSTMVPFEIDVGANKDGSKDGDYHPTLLEQLLQLMQETQKIAESVREDADAGKFDGKDGVACTHTWNGTTLTVASASGTSSADLKGDKGDKGDSYVLTDADKEEIAGKISEVSVPKSEKNNAVYARYDNKDTTIPFSSGSADPYSMVRRDSRGCIISAAPELDNECATKGYVDGLVGDVDVKRTVWVDFDGSCTIEETGWTGTFGELLIKADYGEYATYRSPFALNDLYDFYFVKKLEDVILYFTPLSTKIEQEYRIDYDATATVTLYNDDVKIIYTSDVEENAYTNNYEYRTWSVSVDKNPQNLASTTEFGCVKIGGYIAVTDGVISVDKTALLGDVESSLDEIIALQNAYIGGEDA